MLRVISSPWVRGALNADPVAAMSVEALARVTPLDGTLRLYAKSARGPFTAIINDRTSGFDGYRGSGRTVVDAVIRAFGAAA